MCRFQNVWNVRLHNFRFTFIFGAVAHMKFKYFNKEKNMRIRMNGNE